MLFAADAVAQDAADAAAPSAPGAGLNLFMLLFIVAVFYFMLIRPQQKRAKQHREMLGKLAVGDEVVTAGGIMGKVSDIGESVVSLDTGGHTMRVQKTAVQSVLPRGTLENL